MAQLIKKENYLVFYTLIFLQFFELLGVHYNFIRYFLFGIICLIILKNRHLVLPSKRLLILYTAGILGSCIYSMIFNNQNIIKVLVGSYHYFGLLYCFFIISKKPTVEQVTKALITISIIFCCAYIIQWLIYPIQIFNGATNEVNVGEIRFRMRLPGSACAYILFFYSINQYIIKKKLKFLLYAGVGFIPIIIMGFRSLTALSLLFSVIMIFFISRNILKGLKWFVILLVPAVILSQTDIVQHKIAEMNERQEQDQTFANNDYIRYLAYDYYTNEIFTKPGEKIFGGGAPVDNKTIYSKTIQETIENYRYYWVDLGIVGLSFIIGIPAVFLLVIILVILIIKAKEPDTQYIRFSLLTIILGSIMTSMELYRAGNLIIISFMLCIQFLHNKKKIKQEDK